MHLKKRQLLNPSLLILTLAAALCVVIGIRQLAFFYKLDLLMAIHHDDLSRYNIPDRTIGEELASTLIFRGVTNLITIVAASLITLKITIKKGQHWLNALVVFLVCLVVKYSDLFGISFIRDAIQIPGSLFESYGLWLVIAVNGTLYLYCGILFFVLIWLKFGSRGVPDSIQPSL